MKHRFTVRLGWKLNLLIGAILLVTMIAFVGLDLNHERQTLITAEAQHLEELAQHFAWVIENSGDQDPQSVVMDYERAINQNRNPLYRVSVLNTRSEVIATTNPHLLGTLMDEESLLQDYKRLESDSPTQIFLQDTSQLVATLPVFVATGTSADEHQPLAILISGKLSRTQESLRASLITHTLHLLITALAMMAVINLALSRFVLQPIQNLLAGMKRMEQGEWTSHLPVKANDEIGELTRGYNALGQNLEQTVHRLVRAEKLASVALVAIYLNRALKKTTELIRDNAKFLCQHNDFDSESVWAVGRIFDQTEKIYVICEKFNQDFSDLVGGRTGIPACQCQRKTSQSGEPGQRACQCRGKTSQSGKPDLRPC